MAGIFSDALREPNTQYVLSLSYGKDSNACLEALYILGYPLDRIVHAEVWATDTIPADLPPMVEFKKKADKIILDRYGIKVEHVCATTSAERERERERERDCHSSGNSTESGLTKPEESDKSTDSPLQEELGVTQNSKWLPSNALRLTFEKYFYHTPAKRADNQYRGMPVGFPAIHGAPWCNSRLKVRPLTKRVFYKPLRAGGENKYCSISRHRRR